jgi:UDP-N-acetyl-D-galactosamine dehydrogenase
LASIFGSLGINTQEVLNAAATKWNFHRYSPGLVGGHCIGVDPYYLIHKAKEIGYEPKLLISARTINDSFAIYIAKQIIKKLIFKNVNIKDSKIGVLGITFKENCSDIRNSKVISLIHYLKDWGVNVFISDPHALKEELKMIHNLDVTNVEEMINLDVLVVAVAHDEYKKLTLSQISNMLNTENNLLVDIKSIFSSKDFIDNKIDLYQI